MIYDSFELNSFFNPPDSCRPVYSWMWNEALSKDEIKRQLNEMYTMGIRGVYVIPLPEEFRPTTMVTGLKPSYLSEGYFEMLSFAADYAKTKNMTFWLYDEGGWPSGNANQLVTKNDSSFRLRFIDKNKIRKSGRSDLSNISATEKFISLTHQRHKDVMGESFSSLGPLVFTDEPTVSGTPYTKSVREEYKKITGKRLSARKIARHDDPDFNILYHDICSKLFAENYFRPIKAWCNREGLLSAGHLDKDNEPCGFRKSFHHPMRQLRLLDVPGVDVISGQIMPENDCGFFPRLASSAAEQSGSGLSLTESLSVYGTMTYEQMRYILGYQLVRGINILNFMLVMYNEKGYYALRQRPAFSKNLPGAEFLPEFNRYMASLQYIMRLGKPDTVCALYLPMRSLWADDKDTVKALHNYEQTGRNIEKNHSQFDIIDDDLILTCDDEKLKKGIISMGRANYTAVYIPADKYMPDEVRHRLKLFSDNGGKIYHNDTSEYFPALEISGDSGQLKVHKRICGQNEIYLIFNESAHKINAEIKFPKAVTELDILNKKPCGASENYGFESGEIKVFISGCDSFAAEERQIPGRKICTVETLEIKKLKQFTLDRNGMSYNDITDTPQKVKCGDPTALFEETFSGKCRYKACFTLDSEPVNLLISFGRVHYSCEVIFNGKKITDLLMPPYEAVIDKSLVKKENELVVTVSNTAANAFVHFRTPEEWKPRHIGPYHKTALEFEKKLLSGGLLDKIDIYELK